jgi:hypothetical protein
MAHHALAIAETTAESRIAAITKAFDFVARNWYDLQLGKASREAACRCAVLSSSLICFRRKIPGPQRKPAANP